MNAALLNSSRALPTLNAGPEVDIPRDPSFQTTWEQVGGGVVVNNPPKPSPALDLERLQSWAQTGQKLLEAGKNPGMTVNPSELLSAISAGAVAGASVAGVGAVAGAVIAAVVYVASAFIGGLFGPGPSIYDNAGPNVHWWFTHYAPQAYLDWVREGNRMECLASTQAAAQGYLIWLLSVHNWVAMPPPWSWWVANTTWYNRLDYDYVWDASGIADHAAKENWLQNFYANFGVDWLATKNRWTQNPPNQPGPLMLKDRRFVSDQELEQSGADSNESGDSSTGSGKAVAVGAGLLILAAALKSNTK